MEFSIVEVADENYRNHLYCCDTKASTNQVNEFMLMWTSYDATCNKKLKRKGSTVSCYLTGRLVVQVSRGTATSKQGTNWSEEKKRKGEVGRITQH